MHTSSNVDDKSELEDTESTTSSGMDAVKEHIANDISTFIMYCSRIFQILAALAYLIPVVL